MIYKRGKSRSDFQCSNKIPRQSTLKLKLCLSTGFFTLKSIGKGNFLPLHLELLFFLKGKLNGIAFFSLILTSQFLIVICLIVLSGTCISLERKKNLPFSSCEGVLSKCFLAADDKSTACNTFLQLISGKKPDVTALQFAKPIGVLRFWLLFFFFFYHYRGGGSQQ